MLRVTTTKNEIRFGTSVTVSFQRTLRIPDDGKTYLLPPGLGLFPILRVEDYADRVSASWRERGGVFIPMYQREARLISFGDRWWKPNAVKIGVGNINAVTGDAWDDVLQEGSPECWLQTESDSAQTIQRATGFVGP